MFQLANLPLKELYCEENNLLQHIPVHSQQEDEVLTLKVCFKLPQIFFLSKSLLYSIVG